LFNKNLRSILCILIAVSMLFAFAGCGKSGSDDKTAATTAEEKKDVTVAETTAAEPVEIVFQTWNLSVEDFAKQLEVFNSENPNINVKYNTVPYTDHFAKMKVDLASGGGADVYSIQSGASAVEFKEFMEPIGLFAEKAIGADWKSKFVDEAIKQASVAGEPVGVPFGLGKAGTLWVNKTILDKYKIEIPKTYDEFKKAAQVLRQNKELPFCIGAKDTWVDFDVFMAIANDFNAAKFYAAIEGKEKWTDSDLVKAFEAWQKLFTDKVAQDGALGMNMYNDTVDLFVQNKAPIIPLGEWMLNSYTAGADTQFVKNLGSTVYTAMRIPDMNGDGKVCPLTGYIDTIEVINKNSKHKDEAMTFIKWLTMGTGYQHYMDILLDGPSVKGTAADGKDFNPQLLDNVKLYADWNSDIAGYRNIPYPEIGKALGDNLQALVGGQLTPQKAAEAMEKVSKSIKR
jgi:ABC-type glycerol-3-phosphate transport system substrate-binding protein